MIRTIINFILHLDSYLTPIIQSYGNWVYLLLFFMVLAETGFVLTPFLPGDSLLFISGTFAAVDALNVYALFLLLSAAAIIGDTANYWIGNYFGEKLFSKWIKPEHLEKTRSFFSHYGKKTIFLARFVPIVRTFAPFVAGVGNMNYFTFLCYNVIGGVIWVGLFVFSGFYFGNVPYVKDNLMAVILSIIILSFLPVIVEYVKHQRNKHKIQNTGKTGN